MKAVPLVIVFRVDADATIGVGHAMRCITLGREMISRGHTVKFVSHSMPDLLVVLVAAAGIELIGDVSSVGWANLASDLTIFDGYHLGAELRDAAAQIEVMAIDDNRELPVESCAILLNQNLHAGHSMYEDLGNTRLLIGPSYALLRPEVLQMKPRPPAEIAKVVLLSLGGSDPALLTRPLVEAVLAQSDLAIVVAVGPAYPEREAIVEMATSHSPRVSLDRGDLSDGFEHADIAVVGGGSTLWEVARLGIPAVAAIVADNQVAGSRSAQDHGFVIAVDVRSPASQRPPAGVASILHEVLRLGSDADKRRSMAAAGQALFDGAGVGRVIDAIESEIGVRKLT